MKIKVNPYIIVLDVPCHNLDEFIPELFAHPAVYREVDWAGQASEGVDGQHNVICQLVINPLLLKFFLRNQREIHYYAVIEIIEQIIQITIACLITSILTRQLLRLRKA